MTVVLEDIWDREHDRIVLVLCESKYREIYDLMPLD